MKLFFWLDPLLLITTWLSAGTIPRMLLLALLTVAVTLVLGRVFCGWVCPFGTVHDLARRLLVPRKRRAAQRWSRWQRAKYYVLAGSLLMALLGSHFITIFDPLVLL